jgi:hypothetical protein
MYKKIHAFTFLHSRIAARSELGFLGLDQARSVPLRRRATIVDHHDHVFSGEWRRVVLGGDLIDFHASGEGPEVIKLFIRLQSLSLCLTG